MLTDTGLTPAISRSTTAPLEATTVAPAATTAACTTALNLVQEVGLLVSEMGLAADAGWVDASNAVAATAATLRSAAIAVAETARLQELTSEIDSVPVGLSAPPVVRAREIGFLASRLAAIVEHVRDVDDERNPALASLVTAIAHHLGEDVRELRGVLQVPAWSLHLAVSPSGRRRAGARRPARAGAARPVLRSRMRS